METSKIITKVTNLKQYGFGCRVFVDDQLVLEGRCESKEFIGPTFRDLFRTLDKMGGNQYTAATRNRMYKDGNQNISVKHIWY
jgi:hypothetical protein